VYDSESSGIELIDFESWTHMSKFGVGLRERLAKVSSSLASYEASAEDSLPVTI